MPASLQPATRSLTSRHVTDESIDAEELDREIASCIGSERSLVEFVTGLDGVDPRLPSQLPDWTIGHVMTHIARNADGLLSMMDGGAQYPHGRDGRNADIEAGAGRDWQVLVDDVTSRSAAVEVALRECTDWSGNVAMITGDRPKGQIPLLRQREVEVHRADLGLGHGFADMPPDYVRRDLRVMGMLWSARMPMGLSPLPDAALALDPPTRLAWMMGRVDVDGLEPAGLF